MLWENCQKHCDTEVVGGVAFKAEDAIRAVRDDHGWGVPLGVVVEADLPINTTACVVLFLYGQWGKL